MVRVQTLTRGELVIHGNEAFHGSTLCLATRAMIHLQQGCSGFKDYVADTRVGA